MFVSDVSARLFHLHSLATKSLLRYITSDAPDAPALGNLGDQMLCSLIVLAQWLQLLHLLTILTLHSQNSRGLALLLKFGITTAADPDHDVNNLVNFAGPKMRNHFSLWRNRWAGLGHWIPILCDPCQASCYWKLLHAVRYYI